MIMKRLILCVVLAALCLPLFSQTRKERLFLGVGGYYNHRFSASLPVPQTVRKDAFGVSAELGVKVGGVGMSVIWMIPVTTLFEECGAVPVRQSTTLFRIRKYL